VYKIADARQQIDAVHELVVDGIYCVDGVTTYQVLPMHKLFTGSKNVHGFKSMHDLSIMILTITNPSSASNHFSGVP
jgi:hypothetical protein